MVCLCSSSIVFLKTENEALSATSGLYNKTIKIVIDAPSVIKIVASLIDAAKGVIYDLNMAKLASSITFMVLASFTSVTYDRQMTIVIVL